MISGPATGAGPGVPARYLSVIPDVSELERRARGLLPRRCTTSTRAEPGREATLRANQQGLAAGAVPAPGAARRVGRGHQRSAWPARWTCGYAPRWRSRRPRSTGWPIRDGEVAAATAAARAGALFVLSTRSTCRIEEVGAGGGGRRGQLVVPGVPDARPGHHRRPGAAGGGGRGAGPGAHRGHPVRRPEGPDRGRADLRRATSWSTSARCADLAGAELAASVTPAHIGWLSELSGGLPVLVKGVLRADDAAACAGRRGGRA